MCLVGVAGVVCDPGQVARAFIETPDETPEPQHPLQGLRPVTGRGMAPPAHLALTEAKLRSEDLRPRTRAREPPGRLAHSRIWRAGAHQPPGNPGQILNGLRGGERAR